MVDTISSLTKSLNVGIFSEVVYACIIFETGQDNNLTSILALHIHTWISDHDPFSGSQESSEKQTVMFSCSECESTECLFCFFSCILQLRWSRSMHKTYPIQYLDVHHPIKLFELCICCMYTSSYHYTESKRYKNCFKMRWTAAFCP